MRAGICRRRLKVVAVALLNPQQAGDAGQVRLALPAARQFKPQQGGQRVFGFFAIQALRAVVDQQFTTGARQELLFQHIRMAGMRERQLHAGPRAGLAMRRQVGNFAGAVALKKGCAYGGGNGALSGLVRAHKQVQAVLQAV
ncbi:hypothetical protein D3C72_1140850 [compost metagenome]